MITVRYWRSIHLLFVVAVTLVTACATPGPVPGAAAPARPAVDCPPAERIATSLTVLGGDLALVGEVRRVRLVDGRQVVRFLEVGEAIVPDSIQVAVHPERGRAVVEEQNYDTRLLTPERVLEELAGREARVVWSDEGGAETTRTGQVLASGGGLVLHNDAGVWPIRDGARVEVPGGLPPGLSSRPMLSWQVLATSEGPAEIAALYQMRGLSWSANTVVELDATGSAASVQGWASLRNGTLLSLTGSRLQLLAGEVNVVPGPLRRQAMAELAMDATAGAETAMPAEERLFEYHLYTVPRPIDLGPRQDKDFALYSAERVPARLAATVTLDLGARARRDELPRGVQIVLDHESGGPLDMPLPAGRVQVRERTASGATVLVGQTTIGHLAVGEPLTLAFPVAVRLDASWTPGRVRYDRQGRWRSEGRLDLASRVDRTLPVEITCTLPDAAGRVLVDGREAERLAPGAYRIRTELGAGERRSLRIETRP